MTHRRLSALPVLLFVALGLAGCVTAPTPTPTPSPSPPATPLETSSAEPPTETSATCDTVFTADAYSKLATDGLEPIEPQSADHMATFYPVAAQMVEAGGLTCNWGKPQTDIGLTVAQISDVAFGVWKPALAEAGFVETNDPVPGAYTGPVDPGSGISPVIVVAGDSITFVSAPAFAGWIAPTS